jgi:hypothetical protein
MVTSQVPDNIGHALQQIAPADVKTAALFRRGFGLGLDRLNVFLNYRGCAIGLIALMQSCSAHAYDVDPTEIRGAYLDARGNLVAVKESRQQFILAKGGGIDGVKLAKDRRTIAWIKRHKNSSALFIYRDGVIKRIKGAPFVRQFWFVDLGRKIGVDTGGLHFAGTESLYDSITFARLARFSQSTTPPSGRPSWSESSDTVDYSGD